MRSIYRGEPCLSLTHERGKSPVLLLGLRPGGRGWARLSVCHRGGRGPGQLSPIPVCILQCAPPCSVAAVWGRMVAWWHTGLCPHSSSVCHRRYERRCWLLEVQICKNIQFYDLKYISLGCSDPTPFTPHTDGTELPARTRVRLRIVIPKPKWLQLQMVLAQQPFTLSMTVPLLSVLRTEEFIN